MRYDLFQSDDTFDKIPNRDLSCCAKTTSCETAIMKDRFIFLYSIFSSNFFSVFTKYFLLYKKNNSLHLYYSYLSTLHVLSIFSNINLFKQNFFKSQILLIDRYFGVTHTTFFKSRVLWLIRWYNSCKKSNVWMTSLLYKNLQALYWQYCIVKGLALYQSYLRFYQFLTFFNIYTVIPWVSLFEPTDCFRTEHFLDKIDYEDLHDELRSTLTLKRSGRSVRLYCYIDQMNLYHSIKLRKLHIFGLSLFNCFFLFNDFEFKKYSRSLKFVFSFLVRRYLICLEIFNITISVCNLFAHVEDIVRGILTSNDELIFNSAGSFLFSDCVFELEIADINEEFCFVESDSRETLTLFFRYTRQLFSSYYIDLWDFDQFLLLWYCFCLRFIYLTDFYTVPNKTHQFFISSYIRLSHISYSNCRQLLSFRQIPVKRIKKRITKRLVKLLKHRTWYF